MVFRASRLWVIAATALLVSSVGVGTVWSYFRTGRFLVGQTVRRAVPAAFELNRLGPVFQDLQREILNVQTLAAELDAQIEELQAQIGSMRDWQEKARLQMRKLREPLEEDRQAYEFGGKTFTRRQVEDDLERRLEEYDTMAAQRASKEQILEDRRGMLAKATETIHQLQQQRDRLMAQAESLKIRLETTEMVEATGDFEPDDSTLKQAKEIVRAAERKIRTQELLHQRRRSTGGEIPVDADNRPIVDRIDEILSGRQSGTAGPAPQPKAPAPVLPCAPVKRTYRTRCR